MALSKEDHHDVKSALGKAMANKISKVTRDKVTDVNHKRGEVRVQPKWGAPYTRKATESDLKKDNKKSFDRMGSDYS
jgi:hypothetical protein